MGGVSRRRTSGAGMDAPGMVMPFASGHAVADGWRNCDGGAPRLEHAMPHGDDHCPLAVNAAVGDNVHG